MNSLRARLFFNIGLLMVFFVLIAWCLNAVFLERYYLDNKRRSIIESAQVIDDLYNSAANNLSLELERIADNLGAAVIIVNSDNTIKYSSIERMVNRLSPGKFSPPDQNTAGNVRPAPPPPPKTNIIDSYTVDDKSVIETEHDPMLNITFMVLKRQLADGDVLLIRLPLAAVAESAAYASRFMAFSGLLAMLVGCAWAYFFARKFTAPLQELSTVAHGISQLDFSQKCQVSSNDEIGRLSESINNLSAQLSKAITELNEKNRKLTADVEKERNLDKLRKSFISSVSHELKTPISLILGYAEGLKENVPQDKANRDYYCSVIIDEAERMDKLIRDLLDLSQVESGYFSLKREAFDLSLLVDDVIAKYRTLLADKKITLAVEKEKSVLVNGDALRIEQVIINLLNNAIDHVQAPGLIRLTVIETEGKIRLSIYNTGEHINDDLNNLWLSFYKVDQARTPGLGGSGLGLSIVRAIQELHGNAYGVENAAEGVNFWIEIDKLI